MIGLSGLVLVLLWILVLAVIAWAILYIVNLLPIPEPFKTILRIVLLLVLLLVLLQRLVPGAFP